jgi:hypothetical protein
MPTCSPVRAGRGAATISRILASPLNCLADESAGSPISPVACARPATLTVGASSRYAGWSRPQPGVDELRSCWSRRFLTKSSGRFRSS